MDVTYEYIKYRILGKKVPVKKFSGKKGTYVTA